MCRHIRNRVRGTAPRRRRSARAKLSAADVDSRAATRIENERVGRLGAG